MTMVVTHVPLMMAPQVGTPEIMQQAMPPWCIHTPESSPRLWSVAPPNGYRQLHATASDSYMLPPAATDPNGISKDFLRQVCEPFFEEMLLAVHQAVASQIEGQCAQASPESMQQHRHYQPEPSTTDGSDVSTSEFGAFSTVFSCPSGCVTEEERANNSAPSLTPANIEPHCSQEVQSALSHGSDEKEANVMVCRHWKSKGWCRMEDNCKFLHPERKRGVGSVNGNKAGDMNGVCGNNAEISNSYDQSNIQLDELALIAVCGKKKSAKKRKNKGKAGSLMESDAIPGQFDLSLVGYAGNGADMQYAPVQTMWPQLCFA